MFLLLETIGKFFENRIDRTTIIDDRDCNLPN